MIKELSNTYIIHVVRQPGGGVLSSVKALIAWQRMNLDSQIILFVLGDSFWIKNNFNEIQNTFEITHFYNDSRYSIIRIIKYILRNPVEIFINKLPPRKNYIVHFHFGINCCFLAPVKSSRLDSNIVSISTIHGITVTTNKFLSIRWIFSKIKPYIYKNKNITTVYCSQKIPNNIEKFIGIPFHSVNCVSNGTPSLALFGCPYAHANNEIFTVGFAGRLCSAKGWDLAVKAVLKLHENGFKIRILIAGYGPDAEKVISLQDKYPTVIYFLGKKDDLATDFWPNIDVSILLSESEGLPMTILESLSAGVPVIATNVGGVSEAVIDGITGKIVKSDVYSAEYALLSFINDKNYLSNMSNNCIVFHKNNFSTETMGNNYTKLYKKYLDSNII